MTNKPKVKRYDDMGCPEQICRVDTIQESDDGDFVLYEDYEALQAELEQWKNGSTIRDEQNEELHQYVLELKTEIEKLRTALAESRANDLTAMGYLNQIRALVGGDDFPDMVEICKELVGKMGMLIAAGDRLNSEAEECIYGDGISEVAGSEYWCEFRDALEAATEALAAHLKGGE